MQREIIKTKDNSKTLLIPDINETYHSINGAKTESLHIYIRNGINQHKSSKDKISIFEMGFGTGLNAILTYQYAAQNNLTVDYSTIEKFPITAEEIKELNYINTSELDEYEEIYSKMHEIEPLQTHQLSENFTFTKQHNDIKHITLPENNFDIIYFDAFAPQHQPDLWKVEVLQNMFNALKPNGFLITYCAQGQFKRNLKSIGFTVDGLDGPPGKREITRATKKQ